MNKEELLKLLDEAKAVITGSHFVYKSGKHGDTYLNKDAMLKHPLIASQLGWRIAEEVRRWELRPDVVIGPVVAGALLSQQVAYHLALADSGGSKGVLALYADKDGDGFVIRRGYDADIPGANALVVEDIITTGGSAKLVVDNVRALGGNVLGVAAICNRGKVEPARLGVERLSSLLDLDLVMHPADDCPFCRAGVPVRTDLGHGREFLAAKRGN